MKCPKNFLCDFKIDFQNEEVQIERCSFCGRKAVYGKKRFNDEKYKKDHLRDIIQPHLEPEKFERAYGKIAFKDAMRKIKPYSSKFDDREGMLKEIKDRVRNKKNFLL